MKILVIGAHPADPIDLAGGTIINHTRQGDQVTAVAVTDGFNSHIKDEWQSKIKKEWHDNEEIRIKHPGFDTYLRLCKRNEFFDACSAVGSFCEMLGYSDAPLKSDALIDDIVGLIREHKPDILITHHPNEYSHFDHSECGKAVCIALKKAVQDRGNKHWVPIVYFFAVQFRPETMRLGYLPQTPDILIDLNCEVIKEKAMAMNYFKSQGLGDLEAMMQRMNSMESEMGRADGLRYSEGFTLYYPLKRTLLLDNPINKQFYKMQEK